MFVLCVIVTVVLAVASFGSAMGKLQGVPQMEELLASVGAQRIAKPLAALQLTGAVGVVVGLFVATIGVAAASGLTLYYLGAMAAHARARHPVQQVLFPVPLVILSLAALVLRIVTL